MKVTKTASGKDKIKLSKSEWTNFGKKAGWLDKEAHCGEEQCEVAEAMMEYGGSFVKSLGKALKLADPSNCEKIKIAFPEYWEKYLGFSNNSR
jgi:hypothetical protein